MLTSTSGAYLPTTYDWLGVGLSLLIAVLATFVALTLAERIALCKGLTRFLWLAGGALAMGGGIWSMHFTGMLAMHIPIAVMYDVPTVALSFCAAVLASGIALSVVTRPEMNRGAWLIGGTLMGSGIAAMHFLGMAAMRLCGSVHWNAIFVGFSVLLAVGVSLVAMTLVFSLRTASPSGGAWRRVGAAAIMGSAIAGMHYTGMAAAHFTALPTFPLHGFLIGQDTVGGSAMFFSALLALALVTTVCFVDRYVADQQTIILQQQRYLGSMLSTAPVILIVLDRTGRVVVAEGHDLGAFGSTHALMLGQSFWKIFAGEPALVDQARRALAGEAFSADTFISDLVFDLRWTPVRENGGVETVIAIATDITERRITERLMRFRLLNDPLTELPNRTAMNERLAAMLSGAREWKTHFALAVIDLDRFKEVNDTLGHLVGDELLSSVARRIDTALTGLGIVDGVFRIGGDEFALFLPGRDAAQAADVAANLLRELARPHDVAGYTLDVQASVGLALYPDQAEDEQTLLRCADVAMYVAKNAGLGYAIYDAAHDRHSKTLLALEADMRRAIETGGFELHYQPQMDMNTGRIDAVEALCRWQHPTLGMLPPDQFIPIAEETGLIVPLTSWVIEEALRQKCAWAAIGHQLRIAVNVSMRSLREPGFVESVAALLQRYGVPPREIVIEVTETIIMVDNERSRDAFDGLAALGVELSIDDFGTGYSSLAYLKRLAVHELKIDKSFVLGLADTDSKDAELVRLITDLGHNLNLRVVAEGIENQDVLDILAALGVDVAQGYYISRPMPARAFEQWLPSLKRTVLWNAA